MRKYNLELLAILRSIDDFWVEMTNEEHQSIRKEAERMWSQREIKNRNEVHIAHRIRN
jgi:hypothetical protein